eukprot:7836849-Alexandrium_andersonii.AAC.1
MNACRGATRVAGAPMCSRTAQTTSLGRRSKAFHRSMDRPETPVEAIFAASSCSERSRAATP